MIITRSPFRITLGGGGSDLPVYYRQHGGFVIAAAIDKYVYITVHESFRTDLLVKYLKLERVASAEQLEHPLFREALRLLDLDGKGLEIVSMADLPAGTGLGSSASFTTALLKALHTLQKGTTQPCELAEEACHIEIDRLKEPVGKQDQYIAALGGLACIEFHRDDRVDVEPLRVSPETLYDLEDNLLLFFTHATRSAPEVLREQRERLQARDRNLEAELTELSDIARSTRAALMAGDLRHFATLLSLQWENKRRRGQRASNPDIDRWYALGMRNGALGGKLVGAGGGGFLLFYAEDRARLRRAMVEAGLREVRFRFDFEGTKVVIQ